MAIMILMLDRQQLSSWFGERFQHVQCCDETRAYITGVFTDRIKPGNYLIDESVTLEYNKASQNSDFEALQRIGDHILWVGIINPDIFDSHRMVYENLGRLSYYACYRILHRRWRLYEELADELPRIVIEARHQSMIL